MRILILTNRFPPDTTGGAEILAADVTRALRDRGHEVTVLTSRDRRHLGCRESWLVCALRPVGDGHGHPPRLGRRRAARLIGFYRNAHAASTARRLSRVVSEVTPDVLYVWNIDGIGSVSVLRALSRVELPIVFHLNGYWWQYLRRPQTPFSTVRATWLKRLLIGPVPPLTFTSLIAVSDSIKRAYVATGCPEGRIEVIDNAVGPRFLGPPLRPARGGGRTVLMYAGRLCAEKGPMVALEAVLLLVREYLREAHLDIYGSGDPRYQEELSAFVRRNRLDDVVAFHGCVTQEELIRAYDRSDLLLVPSLWEEPFGLVAIEAMARGVPVIAAAVGALRDVIRHDVDGVLVAPADPQALAGAIARLTDRPEELRRLGEAAWLAVRERYTLTACTRRVERHLEAAIRLRAREQVPAGA